MTTTMKKLVALLTTLCLALSLAACAKAPVEITQISLPETFELTVGDAVDPTEEATYWTSAEDLSDDALSEAVSGLALTWTTEDETVAFIDANGALCAAAEGETVLSVASEDGALTAEAKVIVHAGEDADAEETEDTESTESDPEIDVDVTTEEAPDPGMEDEDVLSESVSSSAAESSTAASSDSKPADSNSVASDSKPAVVSSSPSSTVSSSAAPAASSQTPKCSTCGSTDHTSHPTCGVCGSKDHTSHPTCGVCGSTDHTNHPTQDFPQENLPDSAPADIQCPTCGSTDHTTHPEEPGTVEDPKPVGGNMDKETIVEIDRETGFEAAGNGGNAETIERP